MSLSVKSESHSQSLFDIDQTIVQLMDLREDLQAEVSAGGETPEKQREAEDALEAVNAEIAKWIATEVAKVDNVAAYIREQQVRASLLVDEADRIQQRAARHAANAGRVAEAVINVMLSSGKMKLEGKQSTFSLKRNPPAVEVYQNDFVPSEYRHVTIKVPMPVWDALDTETREALSRGGSVKDEPSLSAISAALKATEPCTCCAGDSPECRHCGGSGRVAGSVPGAHWKPDKYRLSMK